MPNQLDATGLQTYSKAELTAIFIAGIQALYGADVNLGSSTPDGQMMNIFIQAALDGGDLLAQIYNSFDPDNAVGAVLDQRVAINGIQRQAGTYTVTPITIVNSQSVNLYGLDQTAQSIYTISDNAGNQWQLVSTLLGLAAGTHTGISFRAAVPGAQLTIPNTITVPVTIVLGVTSVNNPVPYSSLGINEESDAQLKLRRQKSVSLSGSGWLASCYAALRNVSGVTSAYVYENKSGSTNADGVPGHAIWVIVAGSATPADIAQAIYTKRNGGAGMFGGQTYDITQLDGTVFTVAWDAVVTRSLYVAFTATSINGVTPPNILAIVAGLPAGFIPGVFTEVDINALGTAIQKLDPNTLVTSAGFSQGITETATLSGVAASGTFQLVYGAIVSAAINWNDSIATIQTKLQAMTGLSAALVTGSIASQSLVFDLSLVGNVNALLYVQSNSLQTAGAVAISFVWAENYTTTLTPLSKKNQFVVTSANIIVLPMQLKASATSVSATTGTATFAGVGGYAARYTYTMQSNPSGGTVNSTTGAYTAGGVASTTDVVKVTDAFGNTATASISVV